MLIFFHSDSPGAGKTIVGGHWKPGIELLAGFEQGQPVNPLPFPPDPTILQRSKLPESIIKLVQYGNLRVNHFVCMGRLNSHRSRVHIVVGGVQDHQKGDLKFPLMFFTCQ